MAPSKKDPAALIAALDKRHAELNGERDEARAAVTAAYAALAIPERGPNTVGVGTLHRLPKGVLSIPERRRLAEN